MLNLGITLGDPAGVGPEILVKSFPFLEKLRANFVIFGDLALIKGLAKSYQLKLPSNLNIINLSKIKIIPGQPTEESHLAAVKYIETAIEKSLKGEIRGLVTLPLSKESFKVSGLPYRGHTEFLAEKLRAKSFCMSFYGKRLKVSLATTHLPLKKVSEALNPERILEIAKLSYDFLKKIKRSHEYIKIALCGINPHAGEGGLLGGEEKEILVPVVSRAKEEGIPLYGPYPADSLFYWALKGSFDYIIAIYHDQGLVPFKMLHFKDGVNVTLGLPVVRTSPVHGTAYDIAGKGIADPTSFQASVNLALRLIKKW
ncbi:4-hydroxythreonine-4-phosphate dehydrogenase [Caldimicrobium thiodismutans]|uniref:4-hydroxythreonine-4-phosphate dehydrogenase n=1 Tax=Caldimicrobium thiodismutans TaxID=1653476 RepID=A0A0U5AYA5_9BACT|nr:4-hydroxythreonine-4-phosphate dehydrogenase PdxA [Caldimicrobium thiodismutans]BAU22713.1 4-hydroxythreonine-4-phosphate dehydrogenase [Caldimicrobium thiodismutans]